MNRCIAGRLLTVIAVFFILPVHAAPQKQLAVARKTFDFIVGVDGDFKAALSDAARASSSGKRFYIFFPNGNYPIGTLTGDKNQMTTITTSNLSFIGQDIDSTVISNKAINESISTTATIYFNNANNMYLQDLTILNRGNYGNPAAGSATGRFVALEDRGDKNIYKHIKLLSNQDTYYSLTSRSYWEDGEIHGFVDFICGYGDIFFNKCLLFLENRSTVVITAPATKTSWGYVFMDCTIDGDAGDGYRLGRPWSNQPKCVFINTTMKKVPSSEAWGDPMNVVPTVFAEYNSTTSSGVPVDLSKRRTTYTKDGHTVRLNPVLSSSQADRYTIKNVVGGSDNWQPETETQQVDAPVASLEGGTTISWNNDDKALCWVVFKNNTYFKCVTDTSCDITIDTNTTYTVRAANAMGGLGPVSNEVIKEATVLATLQKHSSFHHIVYYDRLHRQLRITSAAPTLQVTVLELNGTAIYSKTCNNSRSHTITLPLTKVGRGIYLITTKGNGRTSTQYLQVL